MPSYPVSLQRGQHLLPQLDLPRDLVDAVAAAQEWLQIFGGEGGVEGGRRGGRSKRDSGTNGEHADIEV